MATNPCTLVDKPRVEEVDPDIRFLEPEEIEALLRGVPDDDLGRVERRMYLTAAMTGMRQGELLALRWRDVDWQARRVRIRRNFVRGEFGTPKSKRSSRSVPLADRLAGELDRLHRETPWPADDDLVFAHPHTGKPIDRSQAAQALQGSAQARRGAPVRFHDLRHTFGTRMAAQGVPMRALQEMMGHRDFKTTLIYADYAPSAREAEWVEAAFVSPVHELGTEPGRSGVTDERSRLRDRVLSPRRRNRAGSTISRLAERRQAQRAGGRAHVRAGTYGTGRLPIRVGQAARRRPRGVSTPPRRARGDRRPRARRRGGSA